MIKAFFKWIGRIVGSAFAAILVIVFLPHMSRIAEQFMPDESGAAIRASAVLAEKLENSSRLETMKVDTSGVLEYEIKAAFIGTVANINTSYHYRASFGIDLQKVEMQINGRQITFFLPQPEVLQDSLTPVEVYKDDFWFPSFSENDYLKLLENEREACRNKYLSGEYAETLWKDTIEAFEITITPWIQNVNSNLTFVYEKAGDLSEN